MAGDRRRNFYDKMPQRYAEDNKTTLLEAEVNNNRRVRSSYNVSKDRHEASRHVCDSTASCKLRPLKPRLLLG